MQKIKLPRSDCTHKKATWRTVMTFRMDIFIAQKTFKLEQTQIVTSVPLKVRTKICCVLVTNSLSFYLIWLWLRKGNYRAKVKHNTRKTVQERQIEIARCPNFKTSPNLRQKSFEPQTAARVLQQQQQQQQRVLFVPIYKSNEYNNLSKYKLGAGYLK